MSRKTLIFLGGAFLVYWFFIRGNGRPSITGQGSGQDMFGFNTSRAPGATIDPTLGEVLSPAEFEF